MHYRHGDVIITKIENVKGKLKQERGDVIVAEGEVTGHAHRFKTENGEVKLYERDGTFYVKVISETAIITHEEHKAIEIPNGSYIIGYQREYAPVAKKAWESLSNFQNEITWRRVID